jgi:hypothetical protein
MDFGHIIPPRIKNLKPYPFWCATKTTNRVNFTPSLHHNIYHAKDTTSVKNSLWHFASELRLEVVFINRFYWYKIFHRIHESVLWICIKFSAASLTVIVQLVQKLLIWWNCNFENRSRICIQEKVALDSLFWMQHLRRPMPRYLLQGVGWAA